MLSKNWIDVTLGRSRATATEESRAAHLHWLETTTLDADEGIEFGRSFEEDGNDPELVANMLAAIKRNPSITALRFLNVGREFPVEWLGDMLTSDRVTELHLLAQYFIDRDNYGLLCSGLRQCKSLAALEIEYPSQRTCVALSLALEANDHLCQSLESLIIAGLSNVGYLFLSPRLVSCGSLKRLAFSKSDDLCLDAGVDHVVEALERGFPHLEHFTFGFNEATPQAVNKVLDALATKRDIKKFSFASLTLPIVLDDAAPMERFVTANRNLELFGVRNLHIQDMSGVFRAMATNHDKLNEVGLFNTLLSARNASALGSMLGQNRAPVAKLEIANFGDPNKHGPLLRSLSGGLQNNTTVEMLQLYLNEIQDEDLYALADVLEANSHLKKLTIDQQFKRENVTNDNAFVRFAQSLGHNQGLTSLRLEWNQDFGQCATRALLDGVKVNTHLAWVDAPSLTSTKKSQDELHFYLKLNKGPKQALHSPLNIMAYAFARADRCRLSGQGNRVPMPPDAYQQYDSLIVMAGILSRFVSGSERRRRADPPSELYFFVRERCDLFGEAAAVARRHSSNQAQQQEDEEA